MKIYFMNILCSFETLLNPLTFEEVISVCRHEYQKWSPLNSVYKISQKWREEFTLNCNLIIDKILNPFKTLIFDLENDFLIQLFSYKCNASILFTKFKQINVLFKESIKKLEKTQN